MKGKVKRLRKSKRECPRLDTMAGGIKPLTPEPKKWPDATVTEPEAATQG
jgi:hypothetical protein